MFLGQPFILINMEFYKKSVFLFLSLSVILIMFLGCKKKVSSSFCETKISPLYNVQCNINAEDLGNVEGISCNGEHIVILDFYDGNSYTLFSNITGKMIKRFGKIGNGPTEIPLGCTGCIVGNSYYAMDDQVKMIAKYNLDSDNNNSNYIIKYNMDGAQISKIIPINDSLFVASGCYKDKYQYWLFNKYSHVLDFNIEIFNANDDRFNSAHKYLSNQGEMAKHPTDLKFVNITRNTSNIDFFIVNNNKINIIKSIRNEIPEFHIMESAGFSKVMPTRNSVIGYFDVCANKRNIFALYSEKTLGESSYKTDIIHIFDWNGNILKRYKLPKEAYYIAANESNIYTVERNEDGGFVISCYTIN